MAFLSLQVGVLPLCGWDTESHALRLMGELRKVKGLPVLQESQRLGFCLEPAPSDQDFRLFIGDIPLAEALPTPELSHGFLLGRQRRWVDHPYFESARGVTEILLESRPASENADWEPVIRAPVYVLPSKIGESAYRRMEGDLLDISRSLIADLIGKSKNTFSSVLTGHPRQFRSRQDELNAIAGVLTRLEPCFLDIRSRPSARIGATQHNMAYWGGQPLSALSIRHLAQRGGLVKGANLPIRVPGLRRFEDFDIPEHRLILGFLRLLRSRIGLCASAAEEQMEAILEDRQYRDLDFGPGPTLYESVDLPRIRKLEDAVQTAEDLGRRVTAAANSWWLDGVKPCLKRVLDSTIQRSPSYRSAIRQIQQYLLTFSAWHPGDGNTSITKLTGRLFEQWSFFRIVESLRDSGLDLQEWSEALLDTFETRFLPDFERGLFLMGNLSPELKVRIRYEPWILTRERALERRDSLYRGGVQETAWSPDIVLECLRLHQGIWDTVYAVVLDCKYSRHVREQHWGDVSKYLEIRQTREKRQVVKQLWLVVPGGTDSIRCEDPAIAFGDEGPSCSKDETARFTIRVNPGVEPSPISERPAQPNTDAFGQFARGTVQFFLREFGAAADD